MKRYKIIQETNIYDLEEAVNKYLEQGWEVVGGGVFDSPRVMQTIVLPREPVATTSTTTVSKRKPRGK